MRFFNGLPFEIRPYSGCRSGFSSRFYRSALSVSPGYGPGRGRSALRSFGRAGARGIPVCVSVLCCIHKKDTCGKLRRYLLTSRVLAQESVSVLFHLFSYFVECGERHFHQLHLRLLVAFVAVGFCGRRHVEMNLFAGNPFEQAARFLKREFGMRPGMRSPWFSTVLPSALRVSVISDVPMKARLTLLEEIR